MARITPFENQCNKIGYLPTVKKYVILYTIFIGEENTAIDVILNKNINYIILLSLEICWAPSLSSLPIIANN
jgi:hypothetical protein